MSTKLYIRLEGLTTREAHDFHVCIRETNLRCRMKNLPVTTRCSKRVHCDQQFVLSGFVRDSELSSSVSYFITQVKFI